ncbi:MAG: glycosyltransferase, partial [Fusobacteriaceae bacterium]
MKRLLIVTTVQNTIEAFLIPHIKMLERKGYEVWIATSIHKEIPKELEKNRWINISFSRNPFSKSSFKAISEMRELIKNNDFETVHFHTPVAAFLGRYAAMKEKQKNIIYTAHGFHFFKGAPIINWLVYY